MGTGTGLKTGLNQSNTFFATSKEIPLSKWPHRVVGVRTWLCKVKSGLYALNNGIYAPLKPKK